MARAVDLSELDKLNELLMGRLPASGKPAQKEAVTVIEASPLVQSKGGIQAFDNEDSKLGKSVRENYNNLLDENFISQDAAVERSGRADENLSHSRGALVRKAGQLSNEAGEAKERFGTSRDMMLRLIMNQAKSYSNPRDIPDRTSSFSATDLQKSLKDQLDELKKQPDDVSEMDKIVAGLGPALVGLLAGGDAGMNALKLANDELGRVREKATSERKSKIENIGKQIEGTGKLLAAEAEIQKANTQRAKDMDEMDRNRLNDLAASIKALSAKDQEAFLSMVNKDPELLKALLNSDANRADRAAQDAMGYTKETNQTVREGVKQYKDVEDKKLDRENDLKKADITAKAMANRAAIARAERPPTDGMTKNAMAFAGMSKAQQAYERMKKDVGAIPSMSDKFFDAQKSLFESSKDGKIFSDLAKTIPDPAIRRQIQTELDFLIPLLRGDSGAAISADEYTSYGNRFFPRKGDDANTIAEKEASRRQQLENYRVGAGRAPIPEIIQPDFKSQELSREQKIKRLKQLEGK